VNRTAILATAAASRAAAMREKEPGRAARPMRRSAAAEGTGPGLQPVSARLASCEVRGVGVDGPLVFDGFASVTGQFYRMWDMFGEYREQVHVGAFAETLAQPELDVPLVLDHVSSKRIARTRNTASPLILDEVTTGDVTGLHVLAPSLPREDLDVQYIVPKLRSELIDEMSFRFVITSGRWSEDYSEFHIHAVDLQRGDVAIVGYGANPLTAGAGLRGIGAFSDDELRAEVQRRGVVIDLAAGRSPVIPVQPVVDPELERRAALHRILDVAAVGR